MSALRSIPTLDELIINVDLTLLKAGSSPWLDTATLCYTNLGVEHVLLGISQLMFVYRNPTIDGFLEAD